MKNSSVLLSISLLCASLTIFGTSVFIFASSNIEGVVEEDYEEAVEVSNDEFTLRNSIQFGDDSETVIKKETLEFESESKQKLELMGNEFRDSYIDTKEGTIAGIDGGSARYYFLDDSLVEMSYTFQNFDEKADMEASYSTLYDGLVRKYGKPLNNKNETIHAITTASLENAIALTSAFNGDYTDYDEWVVDCGDYKVKIDIIEFTMGDSYYHINLGYRKFTDEDIDRFLEEKQRQQDIVDQDL